MTERHTTKQAADEKRAVKNANRRKALTPATRPSQSRNTDSVSGACKICGDHEWDTDVTRGETSCATCGYVAAQNMIDPGAEWINQANGEDRRRGGAPTTCKSSEEGRPAGGQRGRWGCYASYPIRMARAMKRGRTWLLYSPIRPAPCPMGQEDRGIKGPVTRGVSPDPCASVPGLGRRGQGSGHPGPRRFEP